jgi:hypothetical protein
LLGLAEETRVTLALSLLSGAGFDRLGPADFGRLSPTGWIAVEGAAADAMRVHPNAGANKIPAINPSCTISDKTCRKKLIFF